METWWTQYGDPCTLAAAFRDVVPELSKNETSLRPSILRAYARLRELGILDQDIPPYADAWRVFQAQDRALEMMALHPEMREAVSMLLPPDDASREPSQSSKKTPTKSGRKRRLGSH